MNNELLSIGGIYLITLVLALPLGAYLARVFRGEKNLLDFMRPVENGIYRLSGIDARREMTWQQHMVALLTINLVWFLLAMLVLCTQGSLPLNPDGNPSMSPDLAFNTAISFLVNCNLQHYSGESGLSYLSQIVVITFLQFVSAATGIAAAVVVFNALQTRTTEKLGNFYDYFVKSLTRLLLPGSLLIALILAFNGTPMTLQGKQELISLQGDSVAVSRGPVAAMVAIKELGTNGGGFYGANSAHPLENPNFITNAVENIALVIIPIAMVFALGFYLKRRKLAYMIFGVMTVGFVALLAPTVYYEMHGNPAIAKLGVDQALGAMEGKEIRLGAAASAYWSITNTIISCGSVNSMHDSFMPISGMSQMLGMMTNAFYGGCGVGLLNFFAYLIIAVFIAGLMVGRTPELLGKKIEAREMKIAVIVTLLHPLLILAGTALTAHLYAGNPTEYSGWLANPGYHGFSEMLYEFTSASANNGSGFEGLGDNTPWWNISTGVVLLLARFLPIVGPVAIAGLLARKKYVPESAGTLPADTATFGVMVLAVIVIIAALAFFPALALGPLAEHFSLY
ncbi:potassium-transporting ATPase subunit KdpA [Microvirga sp. STR05]|jgi:K+-transporting ATPase ATPase A chain|uniref:Potassium-transporting ATPase potassium-binding subunit n=2 Tax=Hymenobacter TaxID=89966 RepID=A0ABR8JIL6_9BACT|nr:MULTISPECIES: potassium-transporting ATPase subunit KdpA [Hymenobacter]MBD2715571.1 potassium-transporting ATPase subunit KdpA [Hymenobacter duratus]MBR7950479.1 potassium-transporting ATPase subunit KdpA [Microvirga sp. STR05]WBO84178.1 potassium-transporting ATPase subunit KdpA [Hymenobacter yonginensis]